MALMAELPIGTIIGIRGCRVYTMAGCNSSVVCNSENETMPQGARFKRCIGECCSNYLCNQGLYPVLAPVTPEPVSSYASVIATSSRNPTSSTNGKKPGPTSTYCSLVGSVSLADRLSVGSVSAFPKVALLLFLSGFLCALFYLVGTFFDKQLHLKDTSS